MSVSVLIWLLTALRKDGSRSLPIHQSTRPLTRLSRETEVNPRRLTDLKAKTLRRNPQSQSFSRSYGSALPTSLTYIILSTRGYSPRRPDAVMSTVNGETNCMARFSRTLDSARNPSEGEGPFPQRGPIAGRIDSRVSLHVRKKR